jgi:phosphoribosylanthranilate isomerase
MKMKIKICGISRADDVLYVNEAKPDFVGFVFAEGRRRVTVKQATSLRAEINRAIKSVGVFVDADIEEIIGLFKAGVIDMAQLHGGESPGYIDALRLKARAMPVIKAVCADTADGLRSSGLYAKADYLLFDTGSGGTGRVFDWHNLKNAAIKAPFFLAGGLNIDNAGAALNSLRALNIAEPYAIDVSGGVETGGKKDGEKILKLVGYVRNFNYER